MSVFVDNLRAMGFADYADYLKSPLWAGIRSQVYASKGRMCLECKSHRATQIHHRQYDQATMKGETLNHLVPICRNCHRTIHDLLPTPSRPMIVMPWNPKQHCPSKRKGKTPGAVLHAKDVLRAKQKREARRAKLNAGMVRPKSVVCKECKRTVTLPPEIAWAGFICERCRKAAIGVATSKERRKAAKEIRERSEQILRMTRASVQADPTGATTALREFMQGARMGASLPTDCKRTRL